MNGMTGGRCGGMRGAPWTAGDFAAMLLMWIIMMVGMMVPSAIPMVLIYASVARKAACEGTTLAPTGIFVTGYVVIWSLFSLGATIAQWALDRMALLSPMMMSNSPILGGLLLLTAGIYQLTPAKDACLRHCRSPVDFVSSHWKPGGLGALRMGIEHGGFCLGCCWTLMGLLFFGGVMSLWWIGGLTLFVLLEKVMPFGAIGGRLIGGIVAVWGLMALIQFLET
jgi:predicted metal-binding membrane protein